MYKSNADEEEIIKCFHCGNETIMKKVGEYSWGSRDLKYSDFDFFYQYEMFACPICHKEAVLQILEMFRPLLIKNSLVNGRFDEDLYQELRLEVLKCIRGFRELD